MANIFALGAVTPVIDAVSSWLRDGRLAVRILAGAPDVVQTVRAWHDAGHSQRAIARELGIDRRKVKRIIDHPT